MDVVTGGTNAPCEDNSATSLEDKYAYFNNNFEFEDGDKIVKAVKGNLSKKVAYWENTLEANRDILNIIKEGYKYCLRSHH